MFAFSRGKYPPSGVFNGGGNQPRQTLADDKFGITTASETSEIRRRKKKEH